MNKAMKKRILLPLAVAAAVAITVTGCGATSDTSSPNNSTDGGAPEQATINFATVAPGSSTPELHIGIAQGIYTDHGLDVKEVVGQGGAAQVPALVSGDLDVAGGNWVPFMQAAAQGINVRAISAAGSIVTHGVHGLFVRADSDIKTAADFVGKTLAVNTLGNLGELAYKEAMEAAGVDPKDAKFTELGFGDIAGALERGSVDVGWQPGPFYASAQKNEKLRMVLDFNDIKSISGLPNVGYVAMGSWVDSNPNTVKALAAALDESIDYTLKHPEAVRQMSVEIAHMSEEMANSIALEVHMAKVPRATVVRLMDLMVKWGLLDAPLDLDKVLPASQD